MLSVTEYRELIERASAEEKSHTHHADPEHRMQCRMIRYFRLAYCNHIIMAIPNGGQRNIVTASKLKAEGVVAGVPDLLIPESRHGYNCLWIEVKNGKKGRVSEAQKEMHERLADHGNLVKIARSFEDFVDIVHEYFN